MKMAVHTLNRHNPARRTTDVSPASIVAAAISIVLLSACSSSDNDGPDNETPVILSSTTDELKTSAINASGRSLGSTLSGIQQLASDESADNDLSQGDNPAQQFVASTLALGDDGNAVTTREDNRVTIDPDESQLCAEEFAGTVDINEDQQRCETLLADLTVELLASGEETGTITYLFQENPVISLGYGGGVDSLAVNLGGLKIFADASDALDPDSFGEASTPDNMSGEISFTATNTSNAAGEEAGSIAIAITQPVSINSADTDLSLGNGELFSLSADSASGSGELSFDVGAIAATAPFRDQDIASINLDGFTGSARLDLGETAADAPATFTVSNLGLARGPLQMNINNQQALQMTMETFGFTVSAGSSSLTDNDQAAVQINNTMDISLMLNNAAGLDLDASPSFQAMLSLQAADGTVIGDGGEGFDAPDIRVIQGGPFMLALSASDDENSEELSFTVNAGECLFLQQSEINDSATGETVVDSEQRVEPCP